MESRLSQNETPQFNIEIQKLDRKTREKAKMLYLSDYSLQDIANICNIELDTVRFYVFGDNGTGSNESCWFQIKKKLGPASIAAYVAQKQDVLEKTAGLALNIINESLKRIQNAMDEDSSHVPSIDDIKKLSGIVTDMDKMVRLERGEATQITEHVGLTRAEAVRLLKEDPFAQDVVDEVQWYEVDEEKDDIVEYKPEEQKEIEADVGVSTPWK